MHMIYDDIISELQSRSVYKCETYAPYFIASMATHLFNLYNRERRIYYEAGRIPSLRAHILFVAPPGGMKSFYLEQFLRDEYSILRDTGIPFGFEKKMTEAGFVGKVDVFKMYGETHSKIVYGAAKEYEHGIIGCEEFAGITAAFKQSYGSGLEDQLLTALDSGHIEKRVGDDYIKYNTQCTLWAGTQPTRIDISSGLGRRFMFLLFIPSDKEREELLQHWWESKNKKPDFKNLTRIRERISRFSEMMKVIKRVEFDDDILKFYIKHGIQPYEGSYLDRLLIGYTLSRYGASETVYISIDSSELKQLLRQQMVWREQIGFGADLMQVYYILKKDSEHDYTLELKKLYRLITKMGIDLDTANKFIAKLAQLGIVKRSGATVTLVQDLWEDDM